MPTVDELRIIITANVEQMRVAAAQARAALAGLGVAAKSTGAATSAGMAEAGAATAGMAATSTAAAATTTGAFASMKTAAISLGATLKAALAGLGVVTGVAALVGALKTAISATAALEREQTLLANSLKRSDDVAGDVAALTKRAQALEMVSRYGDDEILSVMRLLATYGMSREEIEKTTQAVMDLAVAKGIDLRSATDLVGKAYAGQLGTLSRYGIIVEKTGDKQKDFASVLKLINDQMGGAAQADVRTFSGAMARLTNVFSDFLRGVGDKLAPALMWVVQALTWLFARVNAGHPLLDRLGETMRKIGAVLGIILSPAISWLGEQLRTLGSVYITKVLEAWNALADAIYVGLRKMVEAYNWLAERLGWTTIDLSKLEAQVESTAKNTSSAIKQMATDTQMPLAEMQQNIASVGATAKATSDIVSAFLSVPGHGYIGGRLGTIRGMSGVKDVWNQPDTFYTTPTGERVYGRAPPKGTVYDPSTGRWKIKVEVSSEGVTLAQGIAKSGGKGTYTVTG